MSPHPETAAEMIRWDAAESHDDLGVDRILEVESFAETVAQWALSLQNADVGSPPLLEQILEGATRLIPAVDYAAVVTLDGPGHLAAQIVVGDGIPRTIMDLQNQFGEGPCLDAINHGQQIRVANSQSEGRWPAFIAAAARAGVASLLCTPLIIAGRTIGALSLMGIVPAFEDESESLARVFAAHTAIALAGAKRQQDMNAALSNRDLIGQAKGILMERFRLTPDRAFAVLVKTSTDNNIKLRRVCEQLCDTGVLADLHPHMK